MAKGKGKAKEKQATDADLFVVDGAGDETLRRQILSSTWDAPAAAHARKGSGKPLKSTQILAKRSRVPGMTNKVQPDVMVRYKVEKAKREKITPELKRRLRAVARKNDGQDRGLWDVTKPEAPLVPGAEVENAGEYDMWASTSHQKVSAKNVNDDIRDIVEHAPIKAPGTLHKHQMLRANTVPKAISMPHPGESYNPTLTDHQKLLAVEHARALAEEQKADILAATKLKIMDGREDYRDSRETGYADEVGSGDEDEEDDAEDGEEGGENGETSEKKKKKQRRKTDKERRRRQANIALEAELRARTRLTKAQRQALSSLKIINGSLKNNTTISLSQLHKRKTELAARLADAGLAEMRSGPSRVPRPKQSYLLSDELPESLRQLKTNGNLWNDWLDSSRRRGRVQMERNTQPGMRKLKGRSLKDKEKVAWRKWDLGI